MTGAAVTSGRRGDLGQLSAKQRHRGRRAGPTDRCPRAPPATVLGCSALLVKPTGAVADGAASNLPSRHVHSHYTRTLADLPWSRAAVRLRRHTRRFFCSSLTCGRQVFTERLLATAARYARRTTRFREALQLAGLMVGGDPGARFVTRLGLRASGDTLLHQTRQYLCPILPTLRVVGADNWAWKRGHRYGTILVDLERHAVLDLLPDRETSSLIWRRAGLKAATMRRNCGGRFRSRGIEGPLA